MVSQPEDPQSVDDVFKVLPKKYQALKYAQPKCMKPPDIAPLVINLEEVFQDLLVIDSGNTEHLFMPLESGIWQEQFKVKFMQSLTRTIRQRIIDRILLPLETVRNHQAQNKDDDKIKGTDLVIDNIKSFLCKLGETASRHNIIKEIICIATQRTTDMGITLKTFDTQPYCIGFTDGVYDFKQKRLITGYEAQKYYITRTVGFPYEDVKALSEETMNEASTFMKQVHSCDKIRMYLLKKLSNSLQGLHQQAFMIHYNIAGKNGKTTLFLLIKETFGDYFMKCNVALLYPQTFTNANQANEELMSLQGTRCALFSEPNSRQKLSASFIKELTGGDEQSCRGNYKTKTNFRIKGLSHLLCNKIPELDDYDGGIARRLVCIPYKSVFVDNPADVNEAENKYLVNEEVDSRFKEWRAGLMKMLLDIADEKVDTPEEVLLHTSKYLSRENTIKGFVNEKIEKTNHQEDFIQLSEVYAAYKEYCKENGQAIMAKKVFDDEIHLNLDECCFRAKSNSVRNIWRGYKLIKCAIKDDYDELDY